MQLHFMEAVMNRTKPPIVPQNEQSKDRAVANWIGIGILMLLFQVVLGGVTRLTGSGLSITEWNVVTGTLPPFSENAWMEEFIKYQQTPQYRILNADFTLADFKFIFFWEWFHRFWARLIGVVFLVGFVYLVSKGKLKASMQKPLLILFLLGALQGAIGWIMVASGLTGDAVYVKPTRLALHFIFALGLISYAYWFYLQLTFPSSSKTISEQLTKAVPSVRKWIWFLLILLIPQLLYGALMAGHKAATAAASWPTINGEWIPDALGSSSTWLKDLIENKITVHFVHRSLAYILLLAVVVFSFRLRAYWKKFLSVENGGKEATPDVNSELKSEAAPIESIGSVAKKAVAFGWRPFWLVWMQVLLGILSVLLSTQIVPNTWGAFEWMAQLHQVVGMLLLLSLVGMLYIFLPAKKS